MPYVEYKQHHNDMAAVHEKKKMRLLLAVVFVMMGIACVVGVTVYAVSNQYLENGASNHHTLPNTPCTDQCLYTLVESIPENLTYPAGSPAHPSTFSGIEGILSKAEQTIEIASFYWTLRADDLPVQDPSDAQGEKLFQDLVFAGKEKGIKIRIVQSQQNKSVADTEYLAKNANADVRSLDFSRLLGSGILHTKMWLIDRKHFYLGSANLDWRSLTQVKELGSIVQNCPCLAEDLGKIFDAYWYLATPESSIPSSWPDSYNTAYNIRSPMQISFNDTTYNTFLSSSPPKICPAGRSQDGDTIVDIIDAAEQFVHIAVMDYFPTTQFSRPRTYWPVIDDALRSAAFNDRHVKVRLLTSYWNHTWDEMFAYLQSLQDLKYTSRYLNIDIEVKMFVVPTYTEAQSKIPYARVNHNKYMVTDKTAYIGTSNWSGDYFRTTGGIGLVVNGAVQDKMTNGSGNAAPDIRQQLADIFERDWNSEYSFNLSHFNRTAHHYHHV